MTPDQLRELADRLEPMSAAPGFDGLDVPALAAWLRQCAEQRPAAYKHTEPNGHVSYFHTDESPCELCVPLYAHPAPAAPPHAMLDSHRRLVEQAIHTAEHPSGMSTHDGKARIDASVLRRMLAIIDSLTAAPQAEPKREPTCLWSRADDDTDVWETRCGHAFTIIDGTPTDNQMAFCCYCGRRVDEEIGGIDE